MSAHFIRLSVISGDDRLNVSLPARRPIAEYLADLLELLRVEPLRAEAYWTLSAPALGALDLGSTLGEAGVRDGAVLHLTPVELAARTPYVDDVIDAVATTVDRGYQRFADGRTQVVSALALAVFTAVSVLVVGLRAGMAGSMTLLGVSAVAVVLAVVVGTRGRQLLGWSLAPVLGAAAVSAVADRPAVAVLGGGAAVFVGIAGAVAITSRRTGIVLGAGGAAVVFGVGALALGMGANVTAFSAWVAPVLVTLLAVAPRMATAASGVLGLTRRGEDGAPVPRPAVDSASARGRDLLDVCVFAAAVALDLAVATLIWTGIWVQAALGVMIAVVVLLRTRAFTGTGQIAPMLTVPVVAAVAGAATVARAIGEQDIALRAVTLAAGGTGVALAVLIAGYARAGEVSGARMARVWDALDPALLVLLFPAVFGAQGIYTYLAA